MCSSMKAPTFWRISLISGVIVKSGMTPLLFRLLLYGAVSSLNAARLMAARSAGSSDTGTMFNIGSVTPFDW